jgi:hypothetical protein
MPEAKKISYKDTLNLPRTDFPMKANLNQKEPEYQKRWKKIKLFERMREKSKGQEKFVFHDGPPYANGPIHLGHLLNKVLKDIVVRSKTMLGYDVDFVPGWDCHGLPIEHKVMKELGEEAKDLSKIKIRYKCQVRRKVREAPGRPDAEPGNYRGLRPPVPHHDARLRSRGARGLLEAPRKGARLQGPETRPLVDREPHRARRRRARIL